MQFALMLESRPEIPFETVRALALEAERGRFAALLHADHLLSVTVQNDPPAGVDAWVVLAALGSVTTTIRLGVRMSPPTWRDPPLLAIAAATLDRLTGGRVEIGVGSGWHEREHVAFGVPFGSASQRFDRLEEALAVLRGLWTTEGFSFVGRYVSVDDAPRVPTAQVPHPPIAIGGAGQRRTPALAARFADEFNAFNGTVDATAAAYARVERACLAQQRDPASLLYSQNMVTVLGEDEHQFRQRMEQLRRQHADPRPLDEFIAVHRGIWLLGTAEDARRALHARAEIGVQRVVLQDEIGCVEMVSLVGRDVLPALQ
jgi:alkanesulfonate monooxygenase SsuD/methylene tetrahydromethanopterin reductase-like flavin-dependent oxidoreductase (luciferase family)